MKKEDTKKTSSTSVLRSDEMRLLVSTGNIRLWGCKMKHDPQIHLVCLNDGLNVEKTCVQDANCTLYTHQKPHTDKTQCLYQLLTDRREHTLIKFICLSVT